MKKFLIAMFLVLLLVVEPFLAKERQAVGLEENEKISVSETFVRLLGELRYSLASYLWLKTEIYHHELGLEETTSHIGTGDPKKIGEILAICRIVTKLDPGFIQAYDIGSWRLAQGLGKFNEALSFLKEGIAHNPKSAALYGDVGMIYFFYMKDYSDAIPYLNESTRLLEDKDITQKVLQLKMLGYSYEQVGKWNEAHQTFQALDKLSPDDPSVKHQLDLIRKKIGR